MDHRLYALWILTAGSVGTKRTYDIVNAFASPKEAYLADSETYRRVLQTDRKEWVCFLNKDLSDAQKLLDTCTAKGIDIIPYNDDAYPERLRQIDQPPVLLFALGKIPDLDKEPGLAIVGTREPQRLARILAAQYGCQFGALGFHVISGMAKGIDTCAHVGALYSNGSTVAVLGCGIDVIYPAQNHVLYREIRNRGCILSEYPPGMRPTKYTFPARNRIISGLSFGTLMVAAPKRSGAIITAHTAADQNRLVFVVPYQTDSKETEGNRSLLEEGATPCRDYKDILNEYMPHFQKQIDPHIRKLAEISDITEDITLHLTENHLLDSTPKKQHTRPHKEMQKSTEKERNPQSISEPDDLTESEQKIYRILQTDTAMSVDEICNQTEIPFHELFLTLQMLEMKQLIQSEIGSQYKKRTH